jgi:hypothetical protein
MAVPPLYAVDRVPKWKASGAIILLSILIYQGMALCVYEKQTMQVPVEAIDNVSIPYNIYGKRFFHTIVSNVYC